MGYRSALLLALVALLAAAPAASAQGSYRPCFGDLTADEVPKRPGPRLDFGINPAGEAGALGPAVPVVPERPERTLAALAELRPKGAPFTLRLNRFFWSLGEPGIKRFLALTRRYTSRGYQVELQLRYHPTEQQEGDIDAWVRHVRDVVRRFGSNRRVVALQVTNEVNLTFSPDSSDGAYEGAKDALIRGVIAAKDEVRRRGYDQLEIGFNWVYRTDPDSERKFWEYLRDRGGRPFVRALDWVGLDAYPGTFFPPAESPGGERDGMVNAMSQLRDCFLPIPGVPRSVPIHIEENGWPTGPGRSEAKQADVADLMIRTVHEFRGTFNVSSYRWFDLRDHNSSSANFQHHYGLMRDDYSKKPAFPVFRRLADELALRAPTPGIGPARPRIKLRVRCGRHGHGRALVTGADRRRVRRVDFRVRKRRVARDRRRPFSRLLNRRHLNRRAQRVSARVLMRDGRALTLKRRLRRCR